MPYLRSIPLLALRGFLSSLPLLSLGSWYLPAHADDEATYAPPFLACEHNLSCCALKMSSLHMTAACSTGFYRALSTLCSTWSDQNGRLPPLQVPLNVSSFFSVAALHLQHEFHPPDRSLLVPGACAMTEVCPPLSSLLPGKGPSP